ncbi:hypothetical protein BDC45DRAFT_496457 [Circinella umbellata]|nr:hypothetical protein BDC45DRAFT_496457 [Circinella umbellata]
MDDESRALIEQMLAEEQYYYGQDTIATLPTTNTNTTINKRKPKKSLTSNNNNSTTKKLKTETMISSASLPSHKTRWTSTEDDLLRSAIEQYGFGNWKIIAAQVKTRNSLQCKNRARHWVLSDKLEKQSVSPSLSTSTKEQQHVTIKKEEEEDNNTKQDKGVLKEDLDDDEEISVEDSDTTPPLSMEVSILHSDQEQQVRTENKIDNINNEEVLVEKQEEEKLNNNNDSKEQETTPMEQDGFFVSSQPNQPTTTKDKLEADNLLTQIKEKEDVTQIDHPTIQGPTSSILPDPQQQQQQVTPVSIIASNNSTTATTASSSTLSSSSSSSLALTSNTPVLKEPQSESFHDNDNDNTTLATNNNNNNILFDKHIISEEEKSSNPEWFCNKYSKTPDRYLKIRNHILDCWQQCKPRYLTKTSARKGLSNCGDVNAIGRVHTYLENIGAINANCINNAPRSHTISKRSTEEENNKHHHDEILLTDENMFVAADRVIGYDGPRKRKVRNELGEWVDPKELEGRVIEHGQEIKASRPKRIIKRPQHHFDGESYDPFRLVPLEYYDDAYPAPFIVDITSDALLVMDFHSHLAHTEIIGLLGGSFINDNNGQSQKILKVQSVFPCKSTSTGIQCEMDPASEMKAREVFAEKGYSVVGWYHSHPTFEPHPSIRDIENQTSYQTLFRHENSGDEPFIGVIVTPYDIETVSDHSLIQYIHISPRWSESSPFRVPYACKRRVHQSEQVSPHVFEEFEKLVMEFQDYEHKVNMLHTFSGSRTRLDKLLDSIRSNLFLPTEQVTEYVEKIRQLILKQFINDTNESSSLSPTSHHSTPTSSNNNEEDTNSSNINKDHTTTST